MRAARVTSNKTLLIIVDQKYPEKLSRDLNRDYIKNGLE